MDSEVKIKIERPKNVSQEEAEDILYKALSMPRDGNAHKEGFDDPAMQSVADLMNTLHEKTIEKTLNEIFAELDKEKF